MVYRSFFYFNVQKSSANYWFWASAKVPAVNLLHVAKSLHSKFEIEIHHDDSVK